MHSSRPQGSSPQGPRCYRLSLPLAGGPASWHSGAIDFADRVRRIRQSCFGLTPPGHRKAPTERANLPRLLRSHVACRALVSNKRPACKAQKRPKRCMGYRGRIGGVSRGKGPESACESLICHVDLACTHDWTDFVQVSNLQSLATERRVASLAWAAATHTTSVPSLPRGGLTLL
jgi:hypothetical protein